ncbi:immunoglobulin superfamily member 1-like [Callorhinchus milii]|uniref:immunoglobulin superfamily member 1-like n=1 Tax=Callorhinchus milii TaxID=7868 RepID=UPI001C3FA8FA|nr:immunoglobulin superfamily member 1-like [Callorhinchus milii]
MADLARGRFLAEVSLPIALLVMVYTMGIENVEAQERLPKPTLTVDPPSGAVTLGDNVTLTCAAPQHTPGMRFFLYKDGADPLQETTLGNVPEVVFQITGVNFQNSGDYYCLYDIGSSPGGSARASKGSDNVKITVEAPRPVLSVSPASVVKGGSVTLTCTAPSSVSPSQFTLYREDQPVRQSPHTGLVKVFEIKAINASDEGRYRCRYQTAQSVKSLPSPRVPLTVREPPDVLLIAGVTCAGALMLLVFIGLVVLCVMKKAKAKGNQDIRSKSEGNQNVQLYAIIEQKSLPKVPLELWYFVFFLYCENGSKVFIK